MILGRRVAASTTARCAYRVGDDGDRDVLGKLAENFEIMLNRAAGITRAPLPPHDTHRRCDVDGVQINRALEHVLAVEGEMTSAAGQISRAASAIDPPISPRPTMPMR